MIEKFSSSKIFMAYLFMVLALPSSAQKTQEEFPISIYSPPPATFINDEHTRLRKRLILIAFLHRAWRGK